MTKEEMMAVCEWAMNDAKKNFAAAYVKNNTVNANAYNTAAVIFEELIEAINNVELNSEK